MTAPSTPSFLVPGGPGRLSNRRGSNTGADALTVQTRYRNPSGGGAPGTIRVIATRTVQAGQSQNPETAWDSGWVGSPATVPTLGPAGVTNAVTYGGRAYYIDTQNGKIYSAPLTGSSVGPSRLEGTFQSLGLGLFTMGTSPPLTFAACALLGHLYLAGSTGGVANVPAIGSLSIASDGTLLGGAVATNGLGAVSNPPGALIGYQVDANSGWLLVMGTVGGNAFTIPLTNAGAGIGNATATTGPTPRINPGVFFDPVNARVHLIGGEIGGVAVATTAFATVTLATGALGAWGVGGSLPAARSGPAIAYEPVGRYVYVIGGGTGVAGATPQTSVYSALGVAGGLTFATKTSLTTAVSMMGAFTAALAGAQPYIAVLGSSTTAIQASLTDGVGGNAAWVSGPQSLVVGNLGTGGVMTTNQDGSVDLTFNYKAFGVAAAVAAFTDGDQVQVSVQFTDQSGNFSPVATTTVKIGQPPTITGQSTGVTVADPTLLFTYVQGAGGAPEASWQVVVRKHSDASLVFDSGVVKGNANNVVANCAPYLLNATLYDITYTVWSADVAIDANSSISGTATGTVTPAYGTAPLQPTGLTVVPDPVNGWFNLSWNDPGGTRSAWRIYYKRASSGGWLLYQDRVPLAKNVGINLMDELAFGVAYSFAVSAINGTAGEGPLGT